MRISITGGAGFIGSQLMDRLMEHEKNEVIVADNYFTRSKDNLKKWIGHPRFELLQRDITEPLLVEVDRIYHLACPASPIFYKYNAVKVERYCVNHQINCSLESNEELNYMEFGFTLRDHGMAVAFQLLHMVLEVLDDPG